MFYRVPRREDENLRGGGTVKKTEDEKARRRDEEKTRRREEATKRGREEEKNKLIV